MATGFFFIFPDISGRLHWRPYVHIVAARLQEEKTQKKQRLNGAKNFGEKSS